MRDIITYYIFPMCFSNCNLLSFCLQFQTGQSEREGSERDSTCARQGAKVSGTFYGAPARTAARTLPHFFSTHTSTISVVE